MCSITTDVEFISHLKSEVSFKNADKLGSELLEQAKRIAAEHTSDIARQIEGREPLYLTLEEMVRFGNLENVLIRQCDTPVRLDDSSALQHKYLLEYAGKNLCAKSADGCFKLGCITYSLALVMMLMAAISHIRRPTAPDNGSNQEIKPENALAQEMIKNGSAGTARPNLDFGQFNTQSPR